MVTRISLFCTLLAKITCLSIKISLSEDFILKSVTKNLSVRVFLKHLTIKINGKSLRRFDRSSVIVGRDVGGEICIDVYGCREVRMCEGY